MEPRNSYKGVERSSHNMYMQQQYRRDTMSYDHRPRSRSRSHHSHRLPSSVERCHGSHRPQHYYVERSSSMYMQQQYRRNTMSYDHRPRSRSRSHQSNRLPSSVERRHGSHRPQHYYDERSGRHYEHSRHFDARAKRPSKRSADHHDDHHSNGPPSKRPRTEHGHPHHDSSRDRRSQRNETASRQSLVKQKVEHVQTHVTSTPEPAVTFPELWGTYVTEADERQMELWRQETEEMLTSAPWSARGQSATDDSRKRLCEAAQLESPRPAKVMYINKNHANFSFLF